MGETRIRTIAVIESITLYEENHSTIEPEFTALFVTAPTSKRKSAPVHSKVEASMGKLPPDFIADLRRLKSWPAMEDSPWRQPYLADLTYGEVHRLIDEFVTGQKLRILDLGCGTGYVSLELAREGHDVTGLDSDKEVVDVAVNSMSADPYGSERGNLDYEVADFNSWDSRGSQYDLVVVGRVLHHFSKPGLALRKVNGLLEHGGRIVCVDFAYDRFDKRAATWLYNMQRTLEQAGWYKSDRKLSDKTEAGVQQFLQDWFEEHEKDGLNRFEPMRRALYKFFREDHFSWLPYLYWSLIEKMRVPSNDVELALARSMSGVERALIESGEINGVLFCFVGSKT